MVRIESPRGFDTLILDGGTGLGEVHDHATMEVFRNVANSITCVFDGDDETPHGRYEGHATFVLTWEEAWALASLLVKHAAVAQSFDTTP